MHEHDLLTVRELADRFRVTPGTARRWVRGGRLPRVKIGRLVLVTREDADALLQSGHGKHVPRAAALLLLCASALTLPLHGQVSVQAASHCIRTIDGSPVSGTLNVITTDAVDRPVHESFVGHRSLLAGMLTEPISIADPRWASHRLRITFTNAATGYVTTARAVRVVPRGNIFDLCTADLNRGDAELRARTKRRGTHARAVNHGA